METILTVLALWVLAFGPVWWPAFGSTPAVWAVAVPGLLREWFGAGRHRPQKVAYLSFAWIATAGCIAGVLHALDRTIPAARCRPPSRGPTAFSS